MADKPAQEKTEPATPKRRLEARKEGKTAKSQELSSIAILLVGIGSMYFILPSSIEQFKEFAVWLLANASHHTVTAANFTLYFKETITVFVVAVGPILLILSVIGLVANFLQVGFVVSTKPLEPKLDKLDVIKGLPTALDDPAPVCEVTAMADSSVNLIVRVWCKTADFWTVTWAANHAIKEALDRNGVEIPFPQLDVHHHGWGGNA